MEHISFTFQIFPISIGLLGFLILLFFKEKIHNISFLRSLWLSGLVLFGLYFLLMTTSTIFRVYHWNIYESGVFETIEEKQKAMRSVTNDTGIQFAFITAAIFSLFISFFELIISSIKNYMKL